MVTCGWYGNCEVHVERPAAYGGGELLALGDALDEGHEDDRGDRPEGAGAAQVHAEAARARPRPRRGAVSTSARSASSISVGGTSVMCVGIFAAVVSPTEVR